jgi:hypothetical protein
MMATWEKVFGRFGVPPWIGLMVLAAVLFLVGAASFGLSGSAALAQVGELGAIVAVAVILAFVGR